MKNIFKQTSQRTIRFTYTNLLTVVFGLLFTAIISSANAQTQTNNYVITQTPRISGINNDSTMVANNTDKTKVQITIQYVDGLGRVIQTVQKQASQLGYDMILPQVYDKYGREVYKYLPYTPQTGTAGSFRSSAVSADSVFYSSPPSGSGITVIADPHSQTGFDNSPLNRPVEQGAPGVLWQLGSHTIKMVYTLNNSTAFTGDSLNGRQASLYYVTIGSDSSRTLHNNGYYAANTLTITISKDENWVSGRAGTMEEYKDIDGRIVLKRAYNYKNNSVEMLSTYYVYDDLGKLSFVLPPVITAADSALAISQTKLNNLGYQYQYDGKNRLVGKKIPGKGWEYTVYNRMDQPVATQDSLQRFNKQWVFTKYDAQQRMIMSGIWNNGGTSISRSSLQSILNGITTNLYEAVVNSGNGYTNVAWPTTNVTATLALSYYDTYSNIPGFSSTGYYITSGVSQLTRSLLTVKKTAVLNTPTDQLWNAVYYDDLGRTSQNYAQHYLGGVVNLANYDKDSTLYNFVNQPTSVTRKHKNINNTSFPLVTITNTYYYDQVGRKRSTWEQIKKLNNTPTTKILISKVDYNEIGQTYIKHLHSTDSVNFLQNVSYQYNARGWLTASSSALFAMHLYYDSLTNKAYNGNIMYQYWGYPTVNNHYTYTYDKLNRLTSGVSTVSNNESSIVYDKMGNIVGMNRFQNGTKIDSLSYTFTDASGNYYNQLLKITDKTTNDVGLKHGTWTYSYDGNGNLVSDPSKGLTGISISYNLVNLPQNITGSKSITYTYDAIGNKLRRVSPATGTTDYINGIEYDGTTTDTLDFIQTEEGKAASYGSNSYDYIYYLSDNLGNTRVTFDTKTGSAAAIQKDDYYPFGFEILRDTLVGSKNEYLYNKKELQEELGEYDYGARFYDPVIARWNVIDPMADDARRWTPYRYGFDNPIRVIDPDGMFEYSNGYQTLNSETDASSTNFSGSYNLTNTETAKVSKGGGLPGTRPTTKADAAKTASKIPKFRPQKSSPHRVPLNPTNQGVIKAWPPPEQVNYQDFGLPSTSLAIVNNTVDTYGAVSGVSEVGAIYSKVKAYFSVVEDVPLATRFIVSADGVVNDLGPTINRIETGGSFPHRNDASIFMNRDGLLPAKPLGYYTEYVHPTPGLLNRPGAMRFVVGQNGEMYFTADHYLTFIRVK
ncbi:DUF6443 domain-containing protein [Mucilaginibacter gotjawali]|uniref:Guanyl-specific ribonuclease Sa3 n=2 Tax=Mucilaginibacter gotjawali TaxID=1550579 RepID=A0A0X8X4P8_9SPHI|nr:DUF6443 domain-containing protein [Mucilaginibacter gotjawali]MBB3058263.1 RHS repeat-associated protein [Mucilaginibacter gotjawali]BAU55619.1 Guanyl-specific ribonuclease Sa3 precursor [Mucilaginibacter gotjawali]